MNIIIFLAISAIISVQVTAEYSYEDFYSRGTHKDNAGVMRHMHDIFSSYGRQSVFSAKSSSDVLTSPLTSIEESGYFSILSYTNSTCSNSNDLALVGSLLLNTCSRSFDGNYTKTIGYAPDTANDFFEVVTSAYMDANCLNQSGASNKSTYPSTCSTRTDTNFIGFSIVSYQASFAPTLTYPTTNTGIISQNYAAEGCAGAPMLSSYIRSGLCLAYNISTTLICSAAEISTARRNVATCPKGDDRDSFTKSKPLSSCENDLEYFIAVNTFGKTPAPGSFSSISCQQAFSPTSSGSNFKGGVIDVLFIAIAGCELP
eukprot:CAMPEP_0119050964 /NCGR_PEP_ID=MMETSP1177-20130426/72736_1 /TAXON_ID=2985 /ORGANISM="Ochromonas sp, Strain CCMP1899" /LENGTH=315 /DNA_ID=CAMNT_0007030007 /DNA_START=69 /DNA_END=1016 /DNA_ORIENTATION=+